MFWLTRLIRSWLKRPCPQCGKPTGKLVEDVELLWTCPVCAEKKRLWDEWTYYLEKGT